MTTIRQHLETIRDCLARHSGDGSNSNYNHAVAALKLLNAADCMRDTELGDPYNGTRVIDDPGWIFGDFNDTPRYEESPWATSPGWSDVPGWSDRG